jgi:hypothetical protein
MKQGLICRASVALAACLAVALATAGTGCLPDDPPVKGRLLVAGSNIENAQFVTIDSKEWVLYSVRRERPRRTKGGVVDLHLVNYDEGTQRLLLEGRAERAEWPAAVDASGLRFLMTDERLSPGGLPVGTLHRVSFSEGIKESVPDVIGYALGGSGKSFYYRRYVEGQTTAELHLRDLEGRDRNLGPLQGAVLLLGDEVVYHIGAPQRTLYRTQGFDGPSVALRPQVSGFQLGAGERFGILTVTGDDGKPRTLVHDFEKMTERPLPVENPCCAIELRGSIFLFADSARPPAPAELHYFNIDTGEDRVVPLPGLLNVSGMVPRPGTQELLVFDSYRNYLIYRPLATDDASRYTAVPIRPLRPEFSPDGRYLIYLVPEPPPPPPAISNFPTGQLWVQSAEDWTQQPRQLSPRGASISIDPKGYLLRRDHPFPLVFWARYGLGASDLYLGDYETGLSTRVAQSIGEVSVSQTHVLGVLNMSQDLTGSLVFRNFAENKEIVIENGVSEVEYKDDKIAFIVRERMASSKRNGLWATILPTLEQVDGAALVVTREESLAGTGQGPEGAADPSPPGAP